MTPSLTGSTATKRRGCRDSRSNQDAGASPLFSPQLQTNEEASSVLQHRLRRDPHQFGVERSTWSLSTLQSVCAWLKELSVPGTWQILHRLRLSLKRGRESVHSPDAAYRDKLQTIHWVGRRVRRAPHKLVLLFQDEFTYERQPRVTRAYAPMGHEQMRARRSHRANTMRRITATLDGRSGRVVYRQASHITIPTLVAFYETLCYEAYPQAAFIYLVQDNWPIHFHPEVLGRLIPQTWLVPPKIPDNWPTAPSPKTVAKAKLPIKILPLPTYASWTNPIEKLWRWLRHDVLHLHRLADQWKALQWQVSHFLDRFARGSTQLLTYVGLTNPQGIYHELVQSTGLAPP